MSGVFIPELNLDLARTCFDRLSTLRKVHDDHFAREYFEVFIKNRTILSLHMF